MVLALRNMQGLGQSEAINALPATAIGKDLGIRLVHAYILTRHRIVERITERPSHMFERPVVGIGKCHQPIT